MYFYRRPVKTSSLYPEDSTCLMNGNVCSSTRVSRNRDAPGRRRCSRDNVKYEEITVKPTSCCESHACARDASINPGNGIPLRYHRVPSSARTPFSSGTPLSLR